MCAKRPPFRIHSLFHQNDSELELIVVAPRGEVLHQSPVLLFASTLEGRTACSSLEMIHWIKHFTSTELTAMCSV